jgi:hypothetical protein
VTTEDRKCGCRLYGTLPPRMCPYHEGASDERDRIVAILRKLDGPGRNAWMRTAANWIEYADINAHAERKRPYQ